MKSVLKHCAVNKSHWDNFLYLLQEMSGGSSSFDVIGVTELYSMFEAECGLNGYHPMEFQTRTNTTDSRGGCGNVHKRKLQI